MGDSRMLPQSRNAIMARNAQISPLLRLPAEIRNKIFAYATFDGTYYPTIKLLERRHREAFIGPSPSWKGFLSTCQQILMEVSPLPYVLNTFFFAGREEFLIFVLEMADSEKPIPTLRLELGSRFESYSVRLCQTVSLPKLERMDVVMSRSNLSGYGMWKGTIWDGYIQDVQSDICEWLEEIVDGNFQIDFKWTE